MARKYEELEAWYLAEAEKLKPWLSEKDYRSLVKNGLKSRMDSDGADPKIFRHLERPSAARDRVSILMVWRSMPERHEHWRDIYESLPGSADVAPDEWRLSKI